MQNQAIPTYPTHSSSIGICTAFAISSTGMPIEKRFRATSALPSTLPRSIHSGIKPASVNTSSNVLLNFLLFAIARASKKISGFTLANIRNYILQQGFYEIEQTGDTVMINVPENNKIKE